MRTRDRNAVLLGQFTPGHTIEVMVQAVDAQGRLQGDEASPRAVITIAGKQDTPLPPGAPAATGYLLSILLTWMRPATLDYDAVEIWGGPQSEQDLAAKLGETRGESWLHNVGSAPATRYYWLRTRATSGQFSDWTEAVTATTTAIGPTDIGDFAVDATKIYLNTVVLSGDSWSNNSPGAGSIAWNAHYLTHQGHYYLVAAGSTALRYVYWDVGHTSGSGTVADPYLTTYSKTATYAQAGGRFCIAVNMAGSHQLVWNSSANLVIGTAFILDAAITNAKIGLLAVDTGNIANLAVTDAKIDTLSANKLTAGTIDASVITVTNLNADNITAGTLTGRTVQTAASGQRLVISGANNNLSFYRSDGAMIRIDDDLVWGLMGMSMYGSGGGIIAIGNSDDDDALYLTHSMIQLVDSLHTMFEVDGVGDMSLYGSISMQASETVDGVDVSAHLHTAAAGQGAKLDARNCFSAGLSITAGKTLTVQNDVTITGALGSAAYTATTAYEASGAVSTHAALTTGVHGVGASTVASVANIATHAALLTGVHGLAITAGKTLTVQDNVTISGALGSAAYTASGAYAPSAHVGSTDGHPAANGDDPGFMSAAGYTKLAGIATAATVGATWSVNITNQPATFPPSAHVHASTDITSGDWNGSFTIGAVQYNVTHGVITSITV